MHKNKTSNKQLRGILPQEILSLMRKLAARRIKGVDIMKMEQLLMGLFQFMDFNKVYDERFFNQMRLHLKYSTVQKMLSIVEMSKAFIMIRRNSDNRLVAFTSPLVNCKVTAPEGCYLVQPELTIIGSDDLVSVCDSQYIYTSKDVGGRTKKSASSRKNDQLVDEPTAEMLSAAKAYFDRLKDDEELMDTLFGAWRKEIMDRNDFSAEAADEAVEILIDKQLVPHIARRRGITTWKDEWITKWVKNIFNNQSGSYHKSMALSIFQTQHKAEREEQLLKQRSNHPYSQYEWTDGEGNRMYYDQAEQSVLPIPMGAPARPADDTTLHPLTNQWITINNTSIK